MVSRVVTRRLHDKVLRIVILFIPIFMVNNFSRAGKTTMSLPVNQLMLITVSSTVIFLTRVPRWCCQHHIWITAVLNGRHPTIVSQAGLDGIEPPFSRSELDFLPLEDSPIRLLVDLPRLELGTSPCKGGVLPLNYRPLAAADGIGPS